jgi:predicted RNA-binding Zn-ribbon protein involved in translation (DUF1610 family)
VSELLNIFAEDSCCARRLSRAIQKGKQQGDQWECPHCGTEWRAELRESDGTPYRYWKPHCPVVLFRV